MCTLSCYGIEVHTPSVTWVAYKLLMVILSTYKVSFLLQGRVNVLQRERSDNNIK